MRKLLLASVAIAAVGCGRLLGLGEDDPPVPEPTIDAGNVTDATAGDAETSTGSAGPCGDFMFCDDFERAAPLGGWEKVASYGGGSVVLSIDTAHAASPSRSLRVDVSGAAAGGSSLVRALPPQTRRVEIAFSLFLEKAVGNNVHPVSIAFTDSSWAFLLLDTGAMSLLDQISDPDAGTKPYKATPIGEPTYGAFERMTLVLDLDAARVELRRASGTITTHPLTLPHGAIRDVAIGAEYAAAAASQLWIDDVAMRWK